MRKPDLTALTTGLEQYLGCPSDPAGPAPTLRVMELDEREPYPHESVRMLRGWGVLESAPAPARPATTPQEATGAQG